MDDAEAKLIANALYEIRLILAAYIGNGVDAPAEIRLAAHLAYALHNEAAALAAGAAFNISSALEKVAAIDGVLGCDDGKRLANLWSHGTETDA